MKNNEHNFDNDSKLPFDYNGKNPFGLPSSYFSSFEDKLKKRLETENELSEFPLLSRIPKGNSFLIPEGYFSLSKNEIERLVELASFETLHSIRQVVFDELEEEYSDHVTTSIQNRIEVSEELRPYSSLFGLDKMNSFDLPANYFEELHSSIKKKIHTTEQANISLFERILEVVFGRRLALSFALVIIVAVSVFVYQTSKTSIELGNCQTMACLEKQEILDNKAINNFDEEQLIDLVDVNSLDKQLKKETVTPDTLQEEFILDNVDTDQLLEEL